MNIQENYNLYIDECGDHNLATYDRNFPIFTLCGILVPVKKINGLKSSIDKLKQDFWGTNDIILHSRDIRKCEKHFQILFDNDVKQRFYTRINDILARQGIYIIVCCSIKKEDCIREHGVEADVYGTALKYVLQRSIFCVDDINPNGGGKINIIVERRGKREDAALLRYYNGLRVNGMHYVSPGRLEEHIGNFEFSNKKDNIFGLQVADLIAYPISRYVMNPAKHNPSYEVIAPNIYQSNGKLLGLKIFPDK
ncbi:MAG: DUF3800 domain-containing protein [Bacteroides sp.]|nr:DUF3800 domain-containing protein [Bacteroides sp.]